MEETTPTERETTAETTPETKPKAPESHGITLALITVTILALGILGFMYFTKDDADKKTTEDESTSILNMEDSNDPAAKVNGVVITKTEFKKNVNSLVESVKAQGLDPADAAVQAQIKDQAITTLTNNQVLIQAANKAGVTVTDAEVEAEYQKIVTRLGGKEAVEVQLKKLAMDEASLRTNIKDALTVTAYIDKEVNPASFTVTDEEINTFYAELQGGEGEIPALADIKDQVKDQLLSQKQQDAVGKFLEMLRSNAKIEILI